MINDRGESERAHISSGPHPDAASNKEYFESYIQRPIIWDKIRRIEAVQQVIEDDWIEKNGGTASDTPRRFFHFDGIGKNSDGTFQDLLCIFFSWKNLKGIKFSYALSLHQSHMNFRKELESFFALKKQDA
jgi:hypothetical protein